MLRGVQFYSVNILVTFIVKLISLQYDLPLYMFLKEIYGKPKNIKCLLKISMQFYRNQGDLLSSFALRYFCLHTHNSCFFLFLSSNNAC